MYMSLAQAKIKSEILPRIKEVYLKIIASRLKSAEGCRHAWLLQNEKAENEFITLSLWSSRRAIEAFVTTVAYQEMMKELETILAESSEWKMQLSENLTLEYVPVSEKPLIDTYDVRTEMDAEMQDTGAVFVRVFSLSIKVDRKEEFVQLYQSVIIAELKKVSGCRAAYLCENRMNDHAYISVTLWDSRNHAEKYEQEGVFTRLVDEVKHTFSDLSTVVTGKHAPVKAITSEDRRIDRFNVVAKL